MTTMKRLIAAIAAGALLLTMPGALSATDLEPWRKTDNAIVIDDIVPGQDLRAEAIAFAQRIAAQRPLPRVRDKTERPESIETGNAVLVGTDPDRIVAWVERLSREPALRARMSRPAFPFGDGRASDRIAAACRAFLEAEADEARLSA